MHDHHNHPHRSHGHREFGRRFARHEHDPDSLRHGGGRRGGLDRGGRDDGGRGGLGRFFAHGDLRLVILNLIAEKPRHGYEIIKAIEEQVGGAYTPSPGVIYPTLTHLEELGHVTVSAADGNKKSHAITPEGQAYLHAHKAGLTTLLARMEAASQSRRGGDAPQIVRAMENLRLALRLRIGRGPLTEDQINAIAAALDAAAIQVERTS